ncbi:hypothetical protein L6R52_07755 [Myxococcota bacterium]|nr:hypothetical protein [Myxococcota bacterium]
MSRIEEHRTRAEHNSQLASDFASAFTDRPEWAIVLRFYSALHLVDAYLELRGSPVSSHGERKAAIRHRSELSAGRGAQFRTAYYWLQNTSEQVRYDPGFVASSAAVAESALHLRVVREFLEPKLSPAPPSTSG